MCRTVGLDLIPFCRTSESDEEIMFVSASETSGNVYIGSFCNLWFVST